MVRYSVIAGVIAKDVDDYGTALGTFDNRSDAENRLEAAVKHCMMTYGIIGAVIRDSQYVAVETLRGFTAIFSVEEVTDWRRG